MCFEIDSILLNERQLFIINLCLITTVAYKFYPSSKANNYISVLDGLPPTQSFSVTNIHCQLSFSCHVHINRQSAETSKLHDSPLSVF